MQLPIVRLTLLSSILLFTSLFNRSTFIIQLIWHLITILVKRSLASVTVLLVLVLFLDAWLIAVGLLALTSHYGIDAALSILVLYLGNGSLFLSVIKI